jgi:general secretion pathway protein J
MKRMRETMEGFTLVEMLVALVLLGLMTAYAVGALRSFGQMSRVTEEIEAGAEVEAVARHLRQSIADARAVFVPLDDEVQKLVFSGRADRLSFVSVLNDRLARGGLYVLDYGAGANQGDFVLRHGLFRPSVGSDSVSAGAEEVNLLRGVESIALAYCAAPCDGKNGWRDSWNDPERFPALVRITVGFPEGDRRRWPETIVPIAAAF